MEPDNMSGLTLHGIHKSFAETRALVGVSFEVVQGEVVAVLGPSGCGKSTLLAIIAGLESPDQGEIHWNGKSLAGIPPHRRDFGLMFQDFALFPHRNVFQNVAFGLQMARLPRPQIETRVKEILELVGLPDFGKRDVNTLSGGEGQRVALARSLAPGPRLLMLDEPLGSLDRNLRERLVVELRDILRDSQQTALYVTHDQEEAFMIADRVVVMNAGQVEQSGTPQEIYQRPACVFVARFLGLTNLIPGEIDHRRGLVCTAIGDYPLESDLCGKVTVLLRPDSVQLNADGPCQIEGTIAQTSFRGESCRAVIAVNDLRLTFNLPSSVRLPARGERVKVCFDPTEALQALPR
jgi:ABC-type Fe3+/spermidine/putrescine transport system ATPase subunit